MTKWRTAAMVVVVDMLTALVLVLTAILAHSTIQKKPPHIPTYGKYAVEIQWPLDRNDADLYVQDPTGTVAYFAAMDAGAMHLEHDDLGSKTTNYQGLAFNYERTVLRGIQTGEYTVNVHYYWGRGDMKIKVILWDLQGTDKQSKVVYVTLHKQGDERTAFRFTLNAAGNVSSSNDLQKKLVSSAANTTYGAGGGGDHNGPNGYGYGPPGG